jgi:hypothetical protein
MKQAEPPSLSRCITPFHFMMGRDSRGNWVVQDEDGLCGGLFVDRVQALRFAMSENGNRPDAVIMVPGVFELDLGNKSLGNNSAGNEGIGSQRSATVAASAFGRGA